LKNTDKTPLDSKSLSLFIDDIKKYPPLKDEEVKVLSEKIQEGDESSRNKLVRHNLRFVITTAKKYRNKGVPFEDLIVAGTMGLISCADKYVFNEETKFLSYAVKGIQRSILRELANMSRCFRIPHRVIYDILDLNRRVANGETLKGEEAIFYTNMQQSISFDTPAVNDNGEENSDYLIEQVSNDTNEGERNIELSEVSDLLREEVYRLLGEQEVKVVKMYFGLEDGNFKTLEGIGKELGVSRARAGFVLQRSLAKLKASGSILDYYMDNGSNLGGS
jgi:RNA polymerase primary sigma factor